MIIRKSRLYLLYSVCLIGGIIFGCCLDDWVGRIVFYVYVFVLISCVVLILGWSHKTIKIVSCGLIFLLLGVMRVGAAVNSRSNVVSISNYNFRNVKLVGQVVSEPDKRDRWEQLTIGRISLASTGELKGKVLIYTKSYSGFKYGDWLKIECLIEAPEVFDGFDYPSFLAAKGIVSICFDPIVSIQSADLDWRQGVYKQILNLKDKAKEIVDRSLSFPQAEILSALFLGYKSNVPVNIRDNFAKTGTSHILAISGLHITIVCGLLVNLFLALGQSKNRSFWLAVTGLVLFLLLIGFRASSLRAGIMGVLLMLALKEGRLSTSINGLLAAALVLLLINPYLWRWDIGFQLSFAAVLGIIYLGPVLNKWLSRLKVPQVGQIRSSLMMTLSAQLMVMPLIIYHFGRLSLIAPLANILILPCLPFLIIGAFMLVLVGFMWLAAAQILAWFLYLGISYLLLVTSGLAGFSFSWLDFGKVSWLVIGLIYLLLGVWIIWIKRGEAKMN